MQQTPGRIENGFARLHPAATSEPPVALWILLSLAEEHLPFVQQHQIVARFDERVEAASVAFVVEEGHDRAKFTCAGPETAECELRRTSLGSESCAALSTPHL